MQYVEASNDFQHTVNWVEIEKITEAIYVVLKDLNET